MLAIQAVRLKQAPNAMSQLLLSLGAWDCSCPSIFSFLQDPPSESTMLQLKRNKPGSASQSQPCSQDLFFNPMLCQSMIIRVFIASWLFPAAWGMLPAP